MIQKAKITGAYQINLLCDNCGKRMGRGVYHRTDGGKYKYLYTCECGSTKLSEMSYPFQQILFDEGNAITMTEDEFWRS